jgi:hypothetical protein
LCHITPGTVVQGMLSKHPICDKTWTQHELLDLVHGMHLAALSAVFVTDLCNHVALWSMRSRKNFAIFVYLAGCFALSSEDDVEVS